MPATVYDVVRARHVDPLAVVSPKDFQCGTGKAFDIEDIINNPYVSLYCFDNKKRQVIFVEIQAAINLTAEPFLKHAQLQYARRLFKVDYNELYQLAEQVGNWFDQLILIYSVGRCGSTLLSKMFSRIAGCYSLSEPDIYTQLLGFSVPHQESVSLLRAVTQLLCRPNLLARPKHLVLKFRGVCVEQAAIMHEAFPESKLIFMYRNAEAAVTSGMRAYYCLGSPLWVFQCLSKSFILRPLLKYLLVRKSKDLQRYIPWIKQYRVEELARLDAVGMLTITWLAGMHRYLTLHETGVPIIALRYEDLLDRPREIFRRLLYWCDLAETRLEFVLEVMKRDAQNGSPLARNRIRHWTMEQCHKQTIATVLERHPIIRRPDFILPASALSM